MISVPVVVVAVERDRVVLLFRVDVSFKAVSLIAMEIAVLCCVEVIAYSRMPISVERDGVVALLRIYVALDSFIVPQAAPGGVSGILPGVIVVH